jgi:hypothetical protein
MSGPSSILHRRHARWFIALLGIALAVLVGFNVAFDPHGLFSGISLDGPAPYRRFGTRIAKGHMLDRFPEALPLLGSSRVECALNPSWTLWGDSGAINLGLTRTSVHELKLVLERVLARTRASELVLGIDFRVFGQGMTVGSEVPYSAFSDADHTETWGYRLLALSTTKQSLTMCAAWILGNRITTYDQRGFRHPKASEGVPIADFIVGARSPMPHPDEVLGADMDRFREMLDAIRARSKQATILILPTHALCLEQIHREGFWPLYEAWTRKLLSIVEEEGNGKKTFPIWDFTSFSGIAAEDISATRIGEVVKARWWYDVSHCRPEIGLAAIRSARGMADDDERIGIRLTHENIRSHIERLRQGRNIYLKDHPSDATLLLSLDTAH